MENTIQKGCDMHGTVDMKDIQVQAVIREYLKAVRDGAQKLQVRIYRANPDLQAVLRRARLDMILGRDSV